MDFEHSDTVQALRARVQAFMDGHVHPNEAAHDDGLARAADRWQPSPVVEALKSKARDAGLWNLFLAHSGRFENVRVPADSILLGEGRGFEIAQGRLGPGRIHHCMRTIGLAERALDMMCARAVARHPFGKPLAEQGVTMERVANSRIMIDQCRLLVLHAAWKMDTVGNKAARREIAAIKASVPNMACQVLDWAVQLHGAAGVSDDFGLARMYAGARTMRLVDGPDEVHRQQLARLELAKHMPARLRMAAG